MYTAASLVTKTAPILYIIRMLVLPKLRLELFKATIRGKQAKAIIVAPRIYLDVSGNGEQSHVDLFIIL